MDTELTDRLEISEERERDELMAWATSSALLDGSASVV